MNILKKKKNPQQNKKQTKTRDTKDEDFLQWAHQ